MWARREAAQHVAALFVMLVLVTTALSVAMLAPRQDPSPSVANVTTGPGSIASASDTVIFGAVGDFDNKAPNYPDMVAEAKRLGARGGMFLLALGDLGYTSDEPGWCSKIKGAFNRTLVVAGNHDTTQSGPGDIDQFVIYCPFNVNSTLVPGPTWGYGKSYYFDYPSANPLVRVLMITPGITGPQVAGQNYGSGGAEYNWVVDAVNGARNAGIPWVVAGMHKLCIDAGSYGCEIGHALFDKMVGLKVDLILHGHYHSYQRSKQLGLNANCTTIPADGSFDADCIVANGTQFTKGAGTIDVIDGAGGRDLYAIPLDGSDKELGYFDAAMGSNGNTENKSAGHGPIVVTLNATTLTGQSTLCPLGTGDAVTGECPSQAGSTFQDSFTISSTGPPPPPALGASFTFAPANPGEGQSVSFTGSASGGTPPDSFGWTFGDGSSDTGADVSHAYSQPGNYTVILTVTDAASHTATAQSVVPVSAPPSGSPTASFSFAPTWPLVGGTVAFNASASSDPGGRPLQFRWDWTNDGAFETSWASSPTATHAYSAAGTVTARLQVRNDLSLVANATNPVPVDGAAPVTSASISATAGSHGWYRSSATVSLSATDDVSGVAATRARSDNGSWVTSSTATFTSDGTHTLDYYSTDRAGRQETTHTLTLHLDSTRPSTVATVSGTKEANGSYRGSANVTLTAADATSGVDRTEFRIDTGSWTAYTATVLIARSGTHTVGFRSTDVAGNVETTKTLTLTIFGAPTQLPGTVLALAGQTGSNSWYTSNVTVTLSPAPDAPSETIWFRLDLGAWQVYDVPFTVGEGNHSLEYNATDTLGIVEASHAQAIRVDTTAPRTTASLAGTPGANRWYVSDVAVTLTAQDDTSGLAFTEYRLDGGAWHLYSGPVSVVRGPHELDYRSTDMAGVTGTPSSVSILVDDTLPHVVVASADAIQTTSTFVLTWGASDDVSGVVENLVSVDGVPYAATGRDTTVTLSLPDGDHTLVVTAVDAAGNRASVSLSVRVDTNIFSPTGPLQGMPTYLAIVTVVGTLLFLVLVRRGRAKRTRREQVLARMRSRAR